MPEDKVIRITGADGVLPSEAHISITRIPIDSEQYKDYCNAMNIVCCFCMGSGEQCEDCKAMQTLSFLNYQFEDLKKDKAEVIREVEI